jgi:protein arginine N-methyltransferase 7
MPFYRCTMVSKSLIARKREVVNVTVHAACCRHAKMSTDKYSGAVVGLTRQFLAPSTGGAGTPDDSSHHTAEHVAAESSVEEILVSEDGSRALEARLTIAGAIDWFAVPDVSIAFKRVVAQSQMASMLKDVHRNAAYADAISSCVSAAAERLGRPPVVLDIGAGTGLLSMLAARAGASRVYAVEQWKVMADIAKNVIRENAQQFPAAEVTVFPFHSAALTVSESGGPTNIPEKADIVISEILDSVLLGEGVIPSLSHAYQHLLTAEAISCPQSFVPRTAEIYAQLVYAPCLNGWHDTAASTVAGVSLARKDWTDVCLSTAKPVPVHASAIPELVNCSDAFAALRFDFSPSGIAASGAQEQAHDVPLTQGSASHANAILCWWRCDLYGATASYSTAPADVPLQGWQDHWVQCIVPISPIDVSVGLVTVVAQCSELQVSFLAAPGKAEVWQSKRDRNRAVKEGKVPKIPVDGSAIIFTDPEPCSCGLHALTSFERRWMLNDTSRNACLSAAAESVLTQLRASAASSDVSASTTDWAAKSILCMGQHSLLGIATAAASMNMELPFGLSIAALEESEQGAVHTAAIAEAAGIGDVLEVWTVESDWLTTLQECVTDEEGTVTKLSAVVAEPVFERMQIHPLWCAFSLFYRLQAASQYLLDDAIICPMQANIKCVLVRLKNLRNNHGMVGSVQGFTHAAFDDAEKLWHEALYTYPMWQYEYEACSEVYTVGVLSYKDARVRSAGSGHSFRAACNIQEGTAPNAAMLWVDYDMAEHAVMSTGPGSRYFRQHIKFFADDIGEERVVHVTVATPPTFTRAKPAFRIQVKVSK